MSNHLGDTNKMVDTPRTDDQIGYDGSTMSAIRIEFCRQLERELNAANIEIEEKRKDVVWIATEKAKLEERIKRLEEAGDGMRIWITVIRGYLPECTNIWRKAKEDKL